MPEAPVCRDCKHRTKRFDCQLAPLIETSLDVVTGEMTVPLYRSCAREREGRACGPEGKKFERASFWKRLMVAVA